MLGVGLVVLLALILFLLVEGARLPAALRSLNLGSNSLWLNAQLQARRLAFPPTESFGGGAITEICRTTGNAEP